MKIIPAIDIIDGKCVRLSQGDYNRKTVYNDNPEEVAKMFRDWGISQIHLVDLDGAKAGRIINYKTIEKVKKASSMVIDFGGGLKSDEDLKIAFESGADMVTGGSIAVKNPDLFLSWLKTYGSNKIILGSDHKAGKIAISGWMQESDLELKTFLRDYFSKGVQKTICTDISVDGMLKGPSVEVYSDLMESIPGMDIVASGGVGQKSHLDELKSAGIKEVIVGKAIYEGRISQKDIQEFLNI